MPEIILCIGAHPDDIDFFCGGTVHQLSKDGKEIYFLITTDGRRGSLNPGTDSQALIETRKNEALAAAKTLGVKDIIFLGYEDGFLDQTPHLELREKYIYWIRKLKPQKVFVFDPWNPYESHSDHRKTALAAYESCYFAHYPLFHPDMNLPKHFVSEIWLYRTPNPNHWISLSTKDLRVKVKALLKHSSQMAMLKQEVFEQLLAASVDTTPIEQVDTKTLIDIFVRGMAEELGKKAGHKFAEEFKVISIGYVEDVKRILSSFPQKS